MKKKILIGSILAVFILMLLPSVSAVEYKIASEVKESSVIEKIKSIDIEELKEKIKDNPSSSEPQCIISLFLIKLIRLFGVIRLITLLMPFIVYVVWACILWIIF